MSPYGENSTPSGIGSKGVRLPGWPVMASAPMVRPWKPFSAARIRGRPVRRAILNAASLASAPELAKKTRTGSSVATRPASRSASVTTPGWM